MTPSQSQRSFFNLAERCSSLRHTSREVGANEVILASVFKTAEFPGPPKHVNTVLIVVKLSHYHSGSTILSFRLCDLSIKMSFSKPRTSFRNVETESGKLEPGPPGTFSIRIFDLRILHSRSTHFVDTLDRLFSSVCTSMQSPTKTRACVPPLIP